MWPSAEPTSTSARRRWSCRASSTSRHPSRELGRASTLLDLRQDGPQETEFNEIYDLTAMRVIVERRADEGHGTATARSG
jgi:hypothetical protein